MTVKDVQGHAVSGATAAALDPFEQANHELRCLIGDPLASAQRAIELAPRDDDGARPRGLAEPARHRAGRLRRARAALQTAAAAGRRARGDAPACHRAAGQRASGMPRAARWRTCRSAGHTTRWRCRSATRSTSSPATRACCATASRAALPALADGRPGLPRGAGHDGLRPRGDRRLRTRRAYGRRAVELERARWLGLARRGACARDAQRRRRWHRLAARRHRRAGAHDSFFAVHNAWHLALFHLGLDQIDEVLALVDERILAARRRSCSTWSTRRRCCGACSCAASMSATAGRRWPIAGRRMPRPGNYAFNDMHAMMAFACAGRDELVRGSCWRHAARGAARARTTTPASCATSATTRRGPCRPSCTGGMASAVALLRPLRSRAHRFGGSHAQRDLIDLTLIEAAARDGQQRLADALRAERMPVH